MVVILKNSAFFICMNAEANMLYLETPIGVGFSYSTDPSSYEGVDDKITGQSFSLSVSFSHFGAKKGYKITLFIFLFFSFVAMDNLAFLHKWLIKFPEYRNRSLYIAGESYAGTFTTISLHLYIYIYM